MRAVSSSDHDQLSNLLADAFAQDPVMRWILPKGTDYQPFAVRYFKQLLSSNAKAGSGYTNESYTGVSLWFGPNDRHGLLDQIVGSAKALWLLKANLPRVFRLQDAMASYRPRKDYLHLTHLGTAPIAQGRGIARSLMQPILDEAKDLKVPVYLECSNPDNLSFYRQFGFRLVDDVVISANAERGPTIYPMILDH